MGPAAVDGRSSLVSYYGYYYFEESVGFSWWWWWWLFFLLIIIIMRRRDFGDSHHLGLKFGGARAPMRRTSFLGFAIVVVIAVAMPTTYHHWRHDGMPKESFGVYIEWMKVVRYPNQGAKGSWYLYST